MPENVAVYRLARQCRQVVPNVFKWTLVCGKCWPVRMLLLTLIAKPEEDIASLGFGT